MSNAGEHQDHTKQSATGDQAKQAEQGERAHPGSQGAGHRSRHPVLQQAAAELHQEGRQQQRERCHTCTPSWVSPVGRRQVTTSQGVLSAGQNQSGNSHQLHT